MVQLQMMHESYFNKYCFIFPFPASLTDQAHTDFFLRLQSGMLTSNLALNHLSYCIVVYYKWLYLKIEQSWKEPHVLNNGMVIYNKR